MRPELYPIIWNIIAEDSDSHTVEESWKLVLGCFV